MEDLIQLEAYPVKNVLKLLLIDKTTKQNIVFATSSYSTLGTRYSDKSHIDEDILLGMDACEIQPRILKALDQQIDRTRRKAEVFTPAWICNKMNNSCDDEWFGYPGTFNILEGEKWITNTEPVQFPKVRIWKEYVDSKRLEITCGEAPFLVSRYDAATGKLIEVKERIGIIDRKLRVVSENTDTEAEWMKWTIRSYQSVYGYEYQGDNLLIARINLLVTFADYMQDKWNRKPNDTELRKIANIITWNIWQMDGLKETVPFDNLYEEYHQLTIFDMLKESEPIEAVPLPCKSYDWRKDRSMIFSSMRKDRYTTMKFDFAVGNPPYQEESSQESESNGQRARKNIFHHFQIQADMITTEGSVMIYPGGRWIHQSGKGLKQFGLEQINDPKLTNLQYYPNSRELFNGIDISDGVSIVVKNKHKSSKSFQYSYIMGENIETVTVQSPGKELMPFNPKDIPIIKKVDRFVHENHLEYLHDHILPRSLFAIESNFVEKNPNKVREYVEGEIIDHEKEIKVFTNDKAGSAGRSQWFVTLKDAIIQNTEFISQWQVVVSSAHAGGQDGRDNQISIIDDMSVFGRARVALKSFKTEDEAKNFYKYMKTSVVRYTLLMTDEALNSLAKKVPDLGNYSGENRLIDFSKDINSQLYRLIGFSPDEVEYIENKVKNG